MLRSDYFMQNSAFEKPYYPHPPLGSRCALARLLEVSLEQLDELERDADKLYNIVEKQKKNGKPRICFNAFPLLKEVQGRIKGRILRQVLYPTYLTGGLPRRDYFDNAKMHNAPRAMVNDDIEDFFPTTAAAIVYDTWRYFFHFPEDVARTLTRLTTRRGGLPQGARTSSYLANLAFWALEPRLVATLRAMGFVYSRYIDDITISTKMDRARRKLHVAMRLVNGMVSRYGLRFGADKHRVTHAGSRMEVTGLIVNDTTAGVTKKKHSKVRAMVHHFEKAAVELPDDPNTLALKRRVSTVLGQYAQFHPKKAEVLKKRAAVAAG